MRVLISILLLLGTCGCLYVPSEDYVHEETQALRGWRNWPAKDMGIEGRELVLVPNFRSFTSEYTAIERRASIMILADEPRDLYFEKAIISNRETGFTLELSLDQTVRIERPYYSTGYYINYAAIQLLDGGNNANFLDSPLIEVRVWYSSDRLAQATSEVFLIRRVYEWNWESPPV